MIKSASKAAAPLDLKRSLLETFAINEKANQVLLAGISDAAWDAPSPTGKGRTISDIAAHVHNVRHMWLMVSAKGTKIPAKVDRHSATRAEILDSLAKSAAIEKLLEKALDDPAGKVSNFKPDVVAFVGYLIAHDSHHRGQISMLARQLGHAISPKTMFALWEWGTLWRESGFSR